MDRVSQLRSDAGGSRDSTLDTSSPPSEAYESANESPSKYFSLSEVDSSFDITPIKDVSLASTAGDSDRTVTDPDELITNLSPISKKNDMLHTYKIGKQIEAANILSGGVDIFDDNDNSYDGDELVIDDNVVEGKSSPEIKIIETEFKDDSESTLIDNVDIQSKDTEVVLQIDGNNVDAIDIGNGIYLYRKEGQEELSAVQIIEDDQKQPSFKFLKVRENAEGNLEVYEEIEIEVPKEAPMNEGISIDKNISQVPIKESKVVNDTASNKVGENKQKTCQKENTILTYDSTSEINKDMTESKPELNLNGKMMKFSEARKSPVVGSFTPMAYHSTPNKEGIPLTKTMVNQQLHPSRHSDNKKMIEVHTDMKKIIEPTKKDALQKVDFEISIDKKTIDKVINSESDTKKDQDNIGHQKDCINKVMERTDCTNQFGKEDKTNLEDTVMQDFEGQKNEMIIEKERATGDGDSSRVKSEVLSKTITDSTVTLNTSEKNCDNEAKTKLSTVENARNLSDASIDNKKESPIEEKLSREISISTCETDIPSSGSGVLKIDISVNDTDMIVTDSKSDQTKKDSMVLKQECNISKSNDKHFRNEETESIVEHKEIIETIAKPKVDKELLKNQNNKEIVQGIDEAPPKDSSDTSKSVHVRHNSESLLNKQFENPNEVMKKLKNIDNLKTTENSEIEKKKDSPICSSNDDQHIVENNTIHIESDLNIDKHDKLISLVIDDTQTVKILDQKIISAVNVDKLALVSDNESNTTEKEVLITNEKSNNITESKVSPEVQKIVKIETAKAPGSSESIAVGITGKVDKEDATDKKEELVIPKVEQKPLNNNLAPVPFGQWTDANRQEFLNKFREVKAPVNSPNGKQIKNSNDLNRRDVLKKIDSQRQSSNVAAKAHESFKANKNEPVFVSKTTIVSQEAKFPDKTDESCDIKQKTSIVKKQYQPETQSEFHEEEKEVSKLTDMTIDKSSVQNNSEISQKKDYFNAQDIIDITIEDMIHRNLPTKNPEENKSFITKKNNETPYDDIELKMNELHGIPFVERPVHELPHFDGKNINKTEKDKTTKNTKIPLLVPLTNKDSLKSVKEQLTEDSEEEIIEHEPITGDIDLNAKAKDQIKHAADADATTIITENEFDKFARRNSVTYENCLTVKFDGKEPHNVIQTVVEKDVPMKYPKSEMTRFDVRSKLPQKSSNVKHSNIQSKIQTKSNPEATNKHYHSKLQLAYQSVLTAKRQMESPITIIEDKPVKVVFIDYNAEYNPSQLNVQGRELSPAKKIIPDVDAVTTSTCDSMDSDVLDSNDDAKSQDEIKIKRHQRKQVLTPVEAPDLELIQPGDLGIEVLPKKKRKTEDGKHDKQTKNLIHKKSYLLGRTTEDKSLNSQELIKTFKDSSKSETYQREPVSALDSLVKAAELLENQSSALHTNTVNKVDSQANTPIKRGRGRPRKYPLPEAADKNKLPSPQKKPKLIEPKPLERETTTEEEESTDEEIIRENWTMGKINENIVCPICNKLFRSENVVFKHVKHCTGVSPSRSDSEKRSPRRMRLSQESESKSDDMDIDDNKPISSFTKKETPKTRKSNNCVNIANQEEVIIIEDTPIKENKVKPEKNDEVKPDIKKHKTKIPKVQNLVCEFCGKTFRQNSYLMSHKLLHKKDEKKEEKESSATASVFNCEVCKKAFRKLHHLVQHRLIHNNTAPSRILRKISSEQKEVKKDQEVLKQNEDPSAGFRCEPCDKSFRKLHHLVEHRETHDGINRQNKTTVASPTAIEKPDLTPECDVCKKTFRKLHHLVEHKEQHMETGSDKSDDKSVKSTLSTKDIIHECSLCYMVFPNEHSLNKHTVICQRKKKSKQTKPNENSDNVVDSSINSEEEAKSVNSKSDIITENNEKTDHIKVNPEISNPKQVDSDIEIIENTPVKVIEIKSDDIGNTKTEEPKNVVVKYEEKEKTKDLPKNVKPVEKETKVRDTPKKKTSLKDKVASTVTKRKKTIDLPLPVIEDIKPVESSDDDEIRYMLNPDFKEETAGDKFMKVRAKKRSSLQIERPNSKDLVKRRTSLQHPPKIPRLKPKQCESKASTSKSILKAPKIEVPSTDSDDSDVKYSFPAPVVTKSKSTQMQTIAKEKKTPRKLSQKRKSLTAIAKRKSSGKAPVGRPKNKTTPMKYVRRRTTEVEHRCDCGQLFSSAALLSRHTSLAHTPPRIRKRRSPPPDNDDVKPRKSTEIPKSRKSTVKSETIAKSVRKSSASEVKSKAAKSEADVKKSASNPRRTPAHRGVPVPEKMRKMMQSFKK